jgi:hypothetical protein
MPLSFFLVWAMSIDDILNKLEAAEQAFEGTYFLAPIVGKGEVRTKVRVRVAGVVCQLTITQDLPRDFQGWAVFQAVSTSEAAFVREATLAEVSAYLRLFPTVRLILCETGRGQWLAFPAHMGDRRFRIQGLVGLLLPERAPA